MALARRSLLFGGLAASLGADEKRGEVPPILIVTTEGLGAWMLGCYGNKEIHTPHIDALAATGTRFVYHYASAPAASATRTAMGDLSPLKPVALNVSPEEPRKEYLDQYSSAKFNTLGWEPVKGVPDILPELRKRAAQATAMDAVIGQWLKANRRENALVVLCGLNGAMMGRHGMLTGGEHTMYDEMVRVPLIWSWYGKVPAQMTRPELVSTYDLLPTLREVSGIQPPPGSIGRSYLLPVTGKPLPKKHPWRNAVYGWQGDLSMVCDPPYKLVLRANGPGELYNLREDPREKVNQYENPGYVNARDRLAKDLAQWRRSHNR